MKKLIITLISLSIVAIFALTPALACEGGRDKNGFCKPSASFSGKMNRDSGTFNVDGDYKIKKDEVTFGDDASLAAGGESAKGSYSASYKGNKYGVGGVVGVGGTHTYAKSTNNTSLAYGVTGNLTVGGIVGRDLKKPCVKISGKGEMNTVAMNSRADNYAGAGTSASFKYAGQTNRGIVAGGGIAGGASYTNQTPHSSTAMSAAGSISGVDNVSLRNLKFNNPS